MPMDVSYCDWQLPAIANEWFFVCWMIIRRINLRTFLLSMTLDHSCRMLVCKLTNCMMPFHLLWGFVFYSSCVAATWSISQRLLQSFDWMLFTCWFGANLRNKKNGRVLLLKMAKKFKIIVIEIVNDYLRNNLQAYKQMDWYTMTPCQSICGTYNPSINRSSSNNLFFLFLNKQTYLTCVPAMEAKNYWVSWWHHMMEYREKAIIRGQRYSTGPVVAIVMGHEVNSVVEMYFSF